MIDIYATHLKDNSGTVKIQSVPAGSEGNIRILNPTVKGDMGNAESMDFSVQNGTPYYDAFQQMRTYMEVVYDGDSIFYGRVLTVNEGFFGEQKLHCEGALAFMNDSYYPGEKEKDRTEQTILSFMQSVLDNHNNQVGEEAKRIYLGEVPGNYSGRISSEQRIENASRKFGATSWTSTKSVLEDLKSHYGGVFRIRRENGRSYLDWVNHYYRSTVNTQTVEVGKNLIDISSATEVSNIFTAIIPIGKTESGNDAIYITGWSGNGLTFNNNYILVPQVTSFFSASELNSGYHRYEDYRNAVNNYGLIFKTVSIEEAHNQTELVAKAAEWIRSNYQGGVTTFSVKAIDLHLIGESSGKILVGDRVMIKYPTGTTGMNPDMVTRTLTCTSVQYDLYNPENNQYTFGIPANALGKTYGDTNQQTKKKASSASPKDEEDEPPEVDETALWLDDVRSWLRTHFVWKKSTNDTPTGYSGSFDHSPLRGYYLQYVVSLDSTGMSNSALIVPNEPTIASGYREGRLESWYDWDKDANGRTKVYPIRLSNEQVNTNLLAGILEQYKLLDFIYYEWGVDLGRALKHKRPSVVDDGNGNVTVYAKAFSVVKEKVGEAINQASMVLDAVAGSFKLAAAKGDRELVYDEFGNFGFYQTTPDGRQVLVTIDENGDYKFIGSDGSETSLRNLHEATENHKNFIGHVIEEGYAGADGEIHAYKFGQEIVKAAVGDGQGVEELVVVYVDGDLIKIGSNRTRSTVSVARYNNGMYVDPKTWVWEEDDKGQKHRVELHITDENAGTFADVGYYDSNGNFIVYTPPEGQTTGPNDEKLYAFVRTGLWDPKLKTFLGGLVTRREESGEIVSYVDSARLVIGNPNDRGMTVMNALLDAGVITQDEYGHPTSHALVAEAVYANKIRAIDAHFQTIETDYLKTNSLESEISKLTAMTVNGGARFNGSLSADHITVDDYIQIANGGKIQIAGYNAQGQYTLYDLGGSVITDADISLSGNTYTLNLYKLKGGKYSPASGKTLSFSRAISAFSGSWSGNILYVTASPQNQTWAREIRVKTYEWSGTNRVIKYTTWMVPGYGSETQYEDSTACTFSTTISISSLISKITADTVAGTSSEDPERTTFTAKAVNSPGTTLASSTFTLSRTTRRVGSSTNKAVVLKEDATGAVVARIDAQTFYTDGYSAGNTAGWNTARNSTNLVIPTSNNTTSSMSVTYPTSDYNTHASRSYEIVTDTDDKVVLRTNLSSTSVPNYVTVASYTHNKYTSGKNAGWNTARNSTNLVIPTSNNTTSSMSVTYPTSDYNTHASRSYEIVTDTDDKVVLRTNLSSTSVPNYVTVASYTHNKYTSGRNSVSASAPTYGTGPSAFNEQTSITVYSNTNTGKSSSGTIELSKGTYVIGTSGITNHCVKLQNGSTVIGLINTENVYTDGANSVINAGGAITQNSNVTNMAINKYVTTLTVNVPTSSGTISWDLNRVNASAYSSPYTTVTDPDTGVSYPQYYTKLNKTVNVPSNASTITMSFSFGNNTYYYCIPINLT